MQDKKNIRVAIYCRLAHHACEDDHSMEVQRKIMRDFAAKNGFTDCAEYIDNGASGTTFNRPEFARLKEDIQKGLVRTVLARDISRISRDYIAYHVWRKWAMEQGLGFITLREGTILPGFLF